MKSVKVYLLDRDGEVQYGLNWGQRENRNPNQAYLQLSPEVYHSDFFPPKGKFFVVETDDNKTIIMNRAQKDLGTALQVPDNNAFLGEYLRQRLGVPSGKEITKEDLLKVGVQELTFKKIDDMHFALHFGEYKDAINEELKMSISEPLQIIYFGAPGTGKSFEIKNEVKGKPHFRTTFHPDTDYASFVGSYKPITKEVPVYGPQGQPLTDTNHNPILEDRIVYKFTFQSFLKAYVKAWEEMAKEQPENVFLVIEEINRGNCAQIFGDIFQLLDRNDYGFSDYPIVADDDLKQELSRVLGLLEIKNADFINSLYPGQGDIVEQIKNGEILLLPNNLFIRATMNTSDQSLFPIDSAFKRRWDWRYVNIKNHEEENYSISFSNGNKYSWWDFLDKINTEIEGGEIQQEDKKLGYFFAKARNGEISAETFLSKVIFFLYNDVFKDFGLEQDFFKDENGKTMTFASYFDHRGKIRENKVETFLENLGLEPINRFDVDEDEVEEEAQDILEIEEDNSEGFSSKKLTIRFPDGSIIQEDTRFASYLKALEKIGLDKVEPIAAEKKYHRKNVALISKIKSDEIINDLVYSYIKSGDYYIVKGTNTRTQKNILNLISDRLQLDLKITVE